MHPSALCDTQIANVKASGASLMAEAAWLKQIKADLAVGVRQKSAALDVEASHHMDGLIASYRSVIDGLQTLVDNHCLPTEFDAGLRKKLDERRAELKDLETERDQVENMRNLMK